MYNNKWNEADKKDVLSEHCLQGQGSQYKWKNKSFF